VTSSTAGARIQRFFNGLLRLLALGLFRMHRFSIRRPRTVLAATALLFAAAYSQLPKLQLTLGIMDMVPPGTETSQDLQHLKAQFRESTTAFVTVAPRDRGRAMNAEELCAFRDWIDESSRDIRSFLEVRSPFELRRPAAKDGLLLYPRILSRDCKPEELARLRDSPWHGLMTDRDGRGLAAEFVMAEAPPDSGFGTFDAAGAGRLRDSFAEFLKRHPQLEGGFLGIAGQQIEALRVVEQKNLTNILVVLTLFLCFRLFFGSWKSGALYLGTLIGSVLALFGAMAALKIPIDVLSTSLFHMVAVAAIEDFLFLSHAQLGDPKGGWRKAYRQILVPGFLTSLTTACGFASLCISSLPTISRFGFWAAMGALLEWLVIFLVLPAAFRLFPRFRTWTIPAKVVVSGSFLDRLAEWTPSRRFAIRACGLFVVAALLIPTLTVRDAPADLFPREHPYRQGLAFLKESRGWEGNLHLVFADADDRAGNEAVLRAAEKMGGVEKVLDPYAVRDYFLEGFEGERRDLIARELSTSRAYEQFFSQRNEAHATLYISDTSLEATQKLLAELESVCRAPHCKATGEQVAYAELASEIFSVLFESLSLSGLSLTAVLFVICLAVGRTDTLLPLVLSSMWGPAAVLVMMAVAGVDLNFTTCIAASVLTGLTGDNAVQFLFASSKKVRLAEGVDERGGGSLMLGFFMAFACLSFLASGFAPDRTLGLLVAFGLLAATFGDVWVLRGLLTPSKPA
jgi:predicted RND superfamily exporter protein